MKNKEIAEIFNNIADILEIKDENPFRIRAYRKAAQNIESLSKDIETVARKKKLTDIPGIGEDLAGKIEEYISKGKIKIYQDLKRSVSKPVLEFMTIPGVGPKTAKLLSEKLKIKSIKDLEKKASQGKIKDIFGIKEKTVTNILRGIGFLKKSEERTPLGEAIKISDEITARLKKLSEVKKVSPAGSLRRMKETVRDIDILVTSNKPRKVMEVFTRMPRVKEVLVHGPTKSSIITKNNIQVDVRVVEPSSFGSALCYFTGSKSHNIALRKMAVEKSLKINEYGVFEVKTKKKIAGADEKDIYKALNLAYVPPEMREDRGEIELAMKDKLPRLVEPEDIKGDIHVHSDSSDGALSLEEIATICQRMGYEYVVITDHSQTLRIAGGLKEKDLFSNIKKVRKLDKKFKKIRLLIGSEVDILSDGELDYKDSVLKELDFVIGAIHSGFKQSRETLTRRIVKAMESKYVNMIAHPTGRLMGVRDAYEINLEKVLKVAKETNTALEINAYPERLDLDDNASRRAKERGVMLGIATDTHTREQLDNMPFGVSVARRGWLEKKHVLNTFSLEAFLKKIKK
ncbi:MAG: DNA polymerase/3'-5' exonuclease PolX [Candidatus Omnitrophota bacterium]|nr:MAG: DNA polymerase/3'-5' exonuclease PolX [Candidatus Omnitrophota bacterium]